MIAATGEAESTPKHMSCYAAARPLALEAPRSYLLTDISPRRIEPERSARRRI
jgi:hypothetical protein